jgi:hypothetical protein
MRNCEKSQIPQNEEEYLTEGFGVPLALTQLGFLIGSAPMIYFVGYYRISILAAVTEN